MWIYIFIGVIVALILLAIVLAFTVGGGPWTSKCTTDGDCLSTEVCMNGSCKLPTGGTCSTGGQCVSGICSNNVCVDSNIPTGTAPMFTPAPVAVPPAVNNPYRPPRPAFVPPPMDYYDDYSEESCGRRPEDPYTIHSMDDSCSTDQTPIRYQSTIPTPIGSNEIITPTAPKSSEGGLLDVINYSDSVVFLYKDGRLRTDKRSLNTRLKISSFALYNGYLIALGRGKVYRLLTSSYDRSDWLFDEFVLPTDVRGDVIRISSPLDGSVLSVQTTHALYTLYSGGIDRLEFPDTTRRVYGPSADMFIDIDMLKRRGIDWLGREYENILDAVINYEGVVTVLTLQSALANGYSGVRIVNWMPYYLLQ